MLSIGEIGWREYGNSPSYLHNFSANLKLFQNKKNYLEKVSKGHGTILATAESLCPLGLGVR